MAATSSLALMAGCGRETPSEVVVLAETGVRHPATTAERSRADELSPRVLRRFAPLAIPPAAPAALVDLGRLLYYEPRLSRSGTVSCNTCHRLDRYGTTSTRVSIGMDGRAGVRNAPTTFNAAAQFTQFWDGRAETIEDQVRGPLENPLEMGMSVEATVAALRTIPEYDSAFRRAFPRDENPMTFKHVSVAIGAFERGLVTPARWDRYLAGDEAALTASEKEGAKLFANLGCLVCHTGPNVGGSMFEKVGARIPWPNQADHGRRQVTGNPADDMVFKVPSLRNVAETSPYFHDGSAATLTQAVHMMARHQLGVELSDGEAADLVNWLGSLTGEISAAYIARPAVRR
ncbi:MAG: cytochrome c peroxidase [Vicinamibacterales bacterium]